MELNPKIVRAVRRTVLLVAGIGIIVLVFLQHFGKQRSKLPVYGVVPHFTLIDEEGRDVSVEDFAGKIFVTDFIFTRCAGTCPIMSEQMQTLQNKFADLSDVLLVSITVDPEYDTKEVLKRYAERYGARPQKWRFLTGEKRSINILAQTGFRLGVSDEGGTPAEPIIHSTKFVLVDREARIRGYYDGTDEEIVMTLVDDIEDLVNEPVKLSP